MSEDADKRKKGISDFFERKTRYHNLYRSVGDDSDLSRFQKIAGKRLIYIESFAKVTSATLTGKLLYKFADQFYVQWKSMLKVYPKAIYLGGIY